MRINSDGRSIIGLFKTEYDPIETIADAEKAVTALVKVPLTKNQFSALVSFVVCEGIELFQETLLLKFINSSSKDWKQFVKAAEQFDYHIYSYDENGEIKPDPYLIEHRKREKALFLLPERVK